MAAKKEISPNKMEFTVFQEKTAFNGLLEFSRPLRIAGKFQGEIKGTNVLMIDKNATVDAHIHVAHAIVYGSVRGNIVAEKKVELREGAKLIGNIRSPNLEIDDGVTFEGQCEMKTVSETV